MKKLFWIFAVIALPSARALADVPPPEGYVETCTLEKQHFNDTECFKCQGDMFSEPDAGEVEDGHCKAPAVYEADGFEKKCKTWGGSAWTEIWCRPSPGTKGPAGDPGGDDGGCAVVTPGRDRSFRIWDILLRWL